jgi:HlyD family secretion protein
MKNDMKRLSVFGWTVIAVGLGMVFSWAAFASLESAAIAYGVVEPSGGMHKVQHLEGGIIKQVHVQDGSFVNKGDKLITLDDTQARVQFERISQRLKAEQLESHRLALELEGNPWELTVELSSEDYAQFVPIQKKLFDSRLQAYNVELDIMDQKIVEYENEINGLTLELNAALKQVKIFSERLTDLSSLMKKNMVTKTEQLEIETGLAEYQGKAGRLKANIARVRQQIGETRLKKMRMGPNRLADITAEYKKSQELQNDLVERLKAAEDILERKAIYSEISGKVTDLQVKASGEVIEESKAIMNIVPASEQMVVRARINPDDIDVVKPGLEVDVRFTAYSSRRMHPVRGTVLEISPDRKASVDGDYFYESIIEISTSSLDANQGIELYPGMSVQLAIISGERTVWEYFLEPVLDTADLSLREQ